MGGCTSSTAARPRGAPKKSPKRKSEDELTRADSERLNAERLQRQKEEEELTRMIYSEKAALKEITSKLIVKTTSCEELMDLLDSEELLDISLNEASFRAQKQARRKLMKQHVVEERHDWMLYNNADGIQEPHMVHLGLFLQKVTSTLARIEAIKATQSEPHSKSDAQLTMLSRGPEGAVVVAPVTPPSSPRLGRSSSGEGAGRLSPAGDKASRGRKRILSDHGGNGERPRERSESPDDPQTISPFRTASLDSGGGGGSSEDDLQLPQDAATLAVIEQQRRLEEEYLQSAPGPAQKASAGGGGGSAESADEPPPSPPPSPTGSPRSTLSEDASGEGSNSGPSTGGRGGALGSPAFNDSLAVGASLALRLGELISPEDDKLLRRVKPGISGILENVRSSKSRHVQYTLSNLSEAAQERCREELLNLQICTIAPQTSYDLTPANLYDYDLPPGLVTLRVARTILQLYRRGGRLSPKSVHKLLRLAYRSLSSRPNISHLTVEPEDTLTVVGDLHGQLPDLLHILEVAGLPGRRNKYIFNGDFVDRGAYGVEVMCTLLALHVALPEQVLLNRGNHEDYAICTAYGFQMECCEKYGDVIFGLFVEIFQQLPLFTIVNKAVMVVHGGLFHTEDASLEELNSIDRYAFSLQDLPEGGETLQPVPRSQREEYLRQLVRDALWSDPADQQGILTSVRGAGVSFGPDVTRAFLEANNLKFVVRSHECVRSGYDEPYSGEDKDLLCTIFSASDYGGANNAAAILRFRLLREGESVEPRPAPRAAAAGDGEQQAEGSPGQVAEEPDDVCVSELKAVRGTNLCYTVHYYYVDPCFFDEQSGSTMWEHPAPVHPPQSPPKVDGVPVPRTVSRRLSLESIHTGSQQLHPDSLPRPPSPQRRSMSSAVTGALSVGDYLEEEGDDGVEALQVSDRDCVLFGARTTLRELIVDRLDELRREFQKLDPRHTGVITKFQWMNVMRETMGLHVRWISLMQVLVLDRHFRSAHGKKMVDYEEFLGSFEHSGGHRTSGLGSDSVGATGGIATDDLGGALVEDEYTALLTDSNGRDVPAVPKAPQQEQQAPAPAPTSNGVGSPRDDAPATDGAASASSPSASTPLAYSSSAPNSGRSPDTSSAARKRVSFLGDGTEQTPDPDRREDTAVSPVSANDGSPRKSVSFAAVTPIEPSNAALAKAGAKRKTFHNHEISKELLEVLYIDHKELEGAFAFFDRDNDGVIMKDEFRAACRELNKYLPRGQRIRDVEALLQLMDFEETGEIPFNNFFELFRLSEMKLNVAIDEEDTLVGFLHHAGGENNKDLVRRSSVVSMSGFGSFHQPSPSGKLEVHGVQINVDSELSKAPSPPSPMNRRSGGGIQPHSPPPGTTAPGQSEKASGKEETAAKEATGQA